MKQTLIFIIALFVNLSLLAQEGSIKDENCKFYKIDIQKKLIPEYKTGQDWKQKYLSENVVELPQLNMVGKGNDILPLPNVRVEYNMPVAKPDMVSSMPVIKPDSTIKYHILVKGEDDLAFKEE